MAEEEATAPKYAAEATVICYPAAGYRLDDAELLPKRIGVAGIVEVVEEQDPAIGNRASKNGEVPTDTGEGMIPIHEDQGRAQIGDGARTRANTSSREHNAILQPVFGHRRGGSSDRSRIDIE